MPNLCERDFIESLSRLLDNCEQRDWILILDRQKALSYFVNGMLSLMTGRWETGLPDEEKIAINEKIEAWMPEWEEERKKRPLEDEGGS